MYKVTMKDGRVYRASKVETAMGFVNMECWDCERKLPAGEVAEIRTVGFENKEYAATFLLIIFLVAFLVALILL